MTACLGSLVLTRPHRLQMLCLKSTSQLRLSFSVKELCRPSPPSLKRLLQHKAARQASSLSAAMILQRP